MTGWLAWAALAALAAWPAWGQAQAGDPAPQPPAVASQDAIIMYHLAPALGEQIDVSVAIRGNGHGLRMDLPDQTFILADTATRALDMVVPLQRTVVNMPWMDGPQTLFMVDGEQRYTRTGEATVAGQACTEWRPAERSATICVTAQGLVLRNESEDAEGRWSLVEARLVRFQSLPAAAYVIPPSYERLSPLPKLLDP